MFQQLEYVRGPIFLELTISNNATRGLSARLLSADACSLLLPHSRPASIPDELLNHLMTPCGALSLGRVLHGCSFATLFYIVES